MKYIVLLLAFLAVANATQTRMGLRKDIKKLTGFSFLGVEAKVTASSEMQHKSAMAVASKASAGVGGMDNCQNCVYVLERIKQGRWKRCLWSMPSSSCIIVRLGKQRKALVALWLLQSRKLRRYGTNSSMPVTHYL